MAEGTTQGILLMSDISGYSEFVRRHTRSAGHARQITVRLLKAIVSASGGSGLFTLEGVGSGARMMARGEEKPEWG